jgi:hypothetical protein
MLNPMMIEDSVKIVFEVCTLLNDGACGLAQVRDSFDISSGET